jgi:hypothetical protein
MWMSWLTQWYVYVADGVTVGLQPDEETHGRVREFLFTSGEPFVLCWGGWQCGALQCDAGAKSSGMAAVLEQPLMGKGVPDLVLVASSCEEMACFCIVLFVV